MTPYYEENGIQIFHGDARQILPQLRGNLVLTDFPYGIHESYDKYVDSEENLTELIHALMPLMLRCAPVVMFSCGVGNMYKYPAPSWVLSWVTPAGAGSGPWGFCCWQPVLVYGKDPYLQHGKGRRPDTIVQTESAEQNGHPCPKPLGVWKWMLSRGSCNESDVIIDPMMGSGMTLRAAKDLGRMAIGIDKSEKYCEIAANQLRQQVISFPQSESSEEEQDLFL